MWSPSAKAAALVVRVVTVVPAARETVAKAVARAVTEIVARAAKVTATMALASPASRITKSPKTTSPTFSNEFYKFLASSDKGLAFFVIFEV